MVKDLNSVEQIIDGIGLQSHLDVQFPSPSVYEAAVKAVEHMDICIGKVYEKVTQLNGTLMIIADHGNCDVMWDEKHNVVTSHTTNPVHCIVTKDNIELKDGVLADVAPTMLSLIGLPIPDEMTGQCLVK